ncbi:MAG: DUF1587 domain-containing protein [Oligoflexales bacterium]|nr:DUF1587 domain-containing protein [Oligoflexales bacterium]
MPIGDSKLFHSFRLILSFMVICAFIAFNSISCGNKSSKVFRDSSNKNSSENTSKGASAEDTHPNDELDPIKNDDCSLAKVEVSYLKVRPIFDEYCVVCHTADNAAGGIILDGNYSSLKTTQWLSAYNSILQRRMPPSGVDLDDESKLTLSAWKNADFAEHSTLVDNPKCTENQIPSTNKNDDKINLISCDESKTSKIAKRAIRLTNSQYKNSILSIFSKKLISINFETLPTDISVNGFNNFAESLNYSSRRYDVYRQIARSIGQEVYQKIGNGEKFNGLLANCDMSNQEKRNTCVQSKQV